jgi:poly(3-hydroxybutyrate) depolymerase
MPLRTRATTHRTRTGPRPGVSDTGGGDEHGAGRHDRDERAAAQRIGVVSSEARRGRLLARPGPPSRRRAAGVRPLALRPQRDGLLMVPAGAAAQPIPLLVWLHGAGADAAGMLGLLEPQARAAGVALLVPESRAATWDVIAGGYGPDVAFIDTALHETYARVPVDPTRRAIGGFSDGASYALSLGLANGDLFRWVLAFSPGFAAPPDTVGLQPRRDQPREHVRTAARRVGHDDPDRPRGPGLGPGGLRARGAPAWLRPPPPRSQARVPARPRLCGWRAPSIRPPLPRLARQHRPRPPRYARHAARNAVPSGSTLSMRSSGSLSRPAEAADVGHRRRRSPRLRRGELRHHA